MEANEPPAPKHYRRLVPIVIVSFIIALGALLAWCWFYRDHPGSSGGPSAATGPCTNGAANPTPAGFSVYENAELGFHFAYPSSWGSVSTTTTPMGGVGGHYLVGSFSANSNVSFGGNATDYVVSAREGIPTDNPGYLVAHNKFYAVQIWKLHDTTAGTDEPKYALYPIEEPSTLKNGCNTKGLIVRYPLYEIVGYSYDVAAFNLQASNLYYGVNFVLKDPNDASRADLDKLVTSFQLIP